MRRALGWWRSVGIAAHCFSASLVSVSVDLRRRGVHVSYPPGAVSVVGRKHDLDEGGKQPDA
jgi:hypothetical protein